MEILVAAVILVGFLCAMDLILTVGVIRRLREHTEQLLKVGGGGAAGRRDDDLDALPVGEVIGRFDATTVDGRSVTAEALTGDTVVAFFAPDCPPCQEKLPEFVEYAKRVPGGRDQVLAVVVGGGAQATDFAAHLEDVASVVVEERGGSVSTAFRVNAIPLVLMIAPGELGRPVVRSHDPKLPAPVAAG